MHIFYLSVAKDSNWITMDKRSSLGFIVVIVVVGCADAANWGYLGEKGVDNWASLFPDACAGRHQSPIDIISSQTIYDPTLRDFALFYDPPLPGSKFMVHNNGHAVQVDTVGKFHVSNGGLTYIYNTAQYHFHWGHKNHHGSEHTIDGKAAPIEMHIVSWNSDKYQSIAEAATEPEGLAVLGILYEVSEKDNPALEPIVQVLVKVRDPDMALKKEIPAISMKHYLPQAPDRYYRYNGSLTTPGCFESVVWTVFHEKQTISRRQLHVFRQVLKPKHHKRSAERRARRAVRNVFRELGIEDDPQAQARFRRNLEDKLVVESTNAENETAIEQPAHTDNGKTSPKPVVNNSHNSNNPAYDTHHHEPPTRKFLVNNYRPVQPLNGRTVYRSFPFFDAPIEKVKTVYVEIEKEPKDKSSGPMSLPSFSFILLSIVFAKFFSGAMTFLRFIK